jgi:TPR repeat protein
VLHPTLRLVAAAVLIWTALSSPSAAQETGVHAQCLAESLRSLRLINSVLTTCGEAPQDCVDTCGPDRPEYCLAAAYAFQAKDDGATARDLFKRACLLGLANACTNYAAGIWAGHSVGESLSCASRLFRAACSAGEHFACGMAGRMAFEQADSPEDYARGRKALEAACSGVGGFPCRVLAKQLETGKLGPHKSEEIEKLLARACEGGDPDACGQPATAEGTFE